MHVLENNYLCIQVYVKGIDNIIVNIELPNTFVKRYKNILGEYLFFVWHNYLLLSSRLLIKAFL